MLTPREESPLPETFSPEEYRTHDAASSRLTSRPLLPYRPEMMEIELPFMLVFLRVVVQWQDAACQWYIAKWTVSCVLGTWCVCARVL